jgi:hypothetical protein
VVGEVQHFLWSLVVSLVGILCLSELCRLFPLAGQIQQQLSPITCVGVLQMGEEVLLQLPPSRSGLLPMTESAESRLRLTTELSQVDLLPTV